MTDSAEWLSVAEAAALLHITERHCRRLAAQLADSDRQTETLPTGRKRLTVRRSAIEDAATAKAGTDTPPEMSGSESVSSVLAETPPMQMAAERVIAEQAARIASLEATQAELLKALQLAQENLSREQTLRALPPPAAEPNESEPPKRWWQRWRRRPTE